MFEALVMALSRRMPVKEAAIVFVSCDPRLWRFIDCDSGRKQWPGRPEQGDSDSIYAIPGREMPRYLHLLYDPDAPFDWPAEGGIAVGHLPRVSR